MKRILVLLFLLACIKGFGQIIPSTVGQVYNFCVGDSFEYSYTETQGPCGPSGSILDIITAYNISGDTITYSYTSFRSLNNSPCPNYNPPYGIIFDSASVTQQFTNADSNIFLLNMANGPFSCQGYTSSQCLDTVYIAESGNFSGKKLNEFVAQILSSSNLTWIDSLGLVNNDLYLEGTPGTLYNTDLYFYRKACNGATWGTFEPFPDYSVYLGINDLLNGSNITLYPNPAANNFELKVTGVSTIANGNIVKLSIHNILGQQIFCENIVSNKTEIDCGLWPKGIYVWTLINDNIIVKNGKLIIE